jgi:hypothetical protein
MYTDLWSNIPYVYIGHRDDEDKAEFEHNATSNQSRAAIPPGTCGRAALYRVTECHLTLLTTSKSTSDTGLPAGLSNTWRWGKNSEHPSVFEFATV